MRDGYEMIIRNGMNIKKLNHILLMTLKHFNWKTLDLINQVDAFMML